MPPGTHQTQADRSIARADVRIGEFPVRRGDIVGIAQTTIEAQGQWAERLFEGQAAGQTLD